MNIQINAFDCVKAGFYIGCGLCIAFYLCVVIVGLLGQLSGLVGRFFGGGA